MSVAITALLGYLIGSVPTANAIAGLMGFDLRTEGSGNPGANNARRLGGYRLAGAVLVAEVAKGSAAVWVGAWLGGQAGMVAGGIGAIAGNVYNVWYRMGGGKGLGISLGVLVAAWPLAALPALLVIGLLALATRSSGIAAMATMTLLLGASLLAGERWPAPWGITDPGLLPWLMAGICLVLAPKHLFDVRNRPRARPAIRRST